MSEGRASRDGAKTQSFPRTVKGPCFSYVCLNCLPLEKVNILLLTGVLLVILCVLISTLL